MKNGNKYNITASKSDCRVRASLSDEKNPHLEISTKTWNQFNSYTHIATRDNVNEMQS